MAAVLALIAVCAWLAALSAAGAAGNTPAERAQALLSQMTLDEKLAMLHGYSGSYVGNVNANERLGIPALHLEDGPQGVADGVKDTTCWPSVLTVVAAWDRSLLYAYSAAMAQEQRIKGTNIMLGPMNNIARVPVGGRNFESTGEDPYLAAQMVVQSVRGIQSEGVMACSKHFADNNQEEHRSEVSVSVDERTQYEIYYPAFKAAVDAGVGSIMCSYNKINGTYACENKEALTLDLKETMGFQGFVMSDWGATHSTVAAANNGLDMEMPSSDYFGDDLLKAINDGQVPESKIDDMTLRILTAMFAVGLFDNAQTGDLSVDSTSEEHSLLARNLSATGTVLLKNDGNLLPLKTDGSIKKIAVLGTDGHNNPIVAGGGSGSVIAPYVITPYEGIKSRASGVEVNYDAGYVIYEAVKAAKEADVAIVFVGVTSSEGSDRHSLSLGVLDNEMIARVADAQPRTIVVVHSPGAVVLPWADKVPALLAAFMPGQEDGNAIAEVLFGDVNPSARLPVTFPADEDQTPLQSKEQYPGIDYAETYSDKLLVGYRWYDAQSEVPQFPFGHGLSYTEFSYSDAEANNTLVSVRVTNVGAVCGSEIAQLYVGFPADAGEPPQQLRGFEKVALCPNESAVIEFALVPARDLTVWDVATHAFVVVHGEFTAFVGASSRDVRAKLSFSN
eukprot:TRINITY_DN6875_c0_g2_i1.p1 TRINITY_DN6875_c0_g2~~TRINITY_DN6875_c0_g2_i1.p1  ORF type:complete len:674 (+),score=207.20 TRINITY_DN6875_c0_g2_i1:12-2033(+)